MAKLVTSISLKGTFDNGLVTEETKDGIEVYDLIDIIRSFEGKDISVSIKEEKPVPTVG